MYNSSWCFIWILDVKSQVNAKIFQQIRTKHSHSQNPGIILQPLKHVETRSNFEINDDFTLHHCIKTYHIDRCVFHHPGGTTHFARYTFEEGNGLGMFAYSNQLIAWESFTTRGGASHRNTPTQYCWWFRNPANQLRLAVHPIVYKDFFTSLVVQNFFHQQYFYTNYLYIYIYVYIIDNCNLELAFSLCSGLINPPRQGLS